MKEYDPTNTWLSLAVVLFLISFAISLLISLFPEQTGQGHAWWIFPIISPAIAIIFGIHACQNDGEYHDRLNAKHTVLEREYDELYKESKLKDKLIEDLQNQLTEYGERAAAPANLKGERVLERIIAKFNEITLSRNQEGRELLDLIREGINELSNEKNINN
jgi:hypothetical protein